VRVTSESIDELSLADWRRRVADIYVDVRRRWPSDPDAALAAWRREREQLFRSHAQSPVLPADRAAFRALHFPVDPALRFEVVVEPDEPPAAAAAETRGPEAASQLGFAAPLLQLPVSGGGQMEFRRIGLPRGNGNRMNLYGTKASFEEQSFAKFWVEGEDAARRIDLMDTLACTSVPVPTEERELDQALKEDFFAGVSSVHPVQRLPKEFAGLRNGHQGSHQFLACDFIEACVNETLPPVHVWEAARYCVPGIVAHESAKQGGVLLEIPDFGDAPQRSPKGA